MNNNGRHARVTKPVTRVTHVPRVPHVTHIVRHTVQTLHRCRTCGARGTFHPLRARHVLVTCSSRGATWRYLLVDLGDGLLREYESLLEAAVLRVLLGEVLERLWRVV